MKNKFLKNNVVIYQTKSGAIRLRGDFDKETIWASQAQIIDIFDIDQSVVSRHVRNVFADGEVSEKSNMQKMHIANSDKPVTLYSLDVILAVGYRANSAKAIQFRRWATHILHEHLVEGYTINRDFIRKNYDAFMKAIEQVKMLLPPGDVVGAGSALELVKLFADTWFSLDAYDKSSLPKRGTIKKQVQLTTDDLHNALRKLKQELVAKHEATELFGVDRQQDSVAGIVGNVFQSFEGKDLYPTVEEKAAHLLYFMIKNHPFTDGNKRSGAFAFVWFLKKARILDTTRLTPTALTTLTLLIAESDPKEKERLVGLVIMLVKKQ